MVNLIQIHQTKSKGLANDDTAKKFIDSSASVVGEKHTTTAGLQGTPTEANFSGFAR